MFLQAQEACGGEEEKLWERYYDEQHEMLNATRPKVVGHFDLVRLFSEEPDRRVKGWREGVWRRMKRNLEECKGLGAWLEVNTSALRKGLEEPYPAREVAEVSSFLVFSVPLGLTEHTREKKKKVARAVANQQIW